MKLSKAVKDGYSKADCKGSHFRGLRNVGTSEVQSYYRKFMMAVFHYKS